jgi:hypothetical protein
LFPPIDLGLRCSDEGLAEVHGSENRLFVLSAGQFHISDEGSIQTTQIQATDVGLFVVIID